MPDMVRILPGPMAELVERSLAEAVSIAETIYGKQHRETIVAKSNLMNTIAGEGRYAEALKGHLEILRDESTLAAKRPEQPGYTYNSIAADYLGLGRFAEAESAARHAIAVWDSIDPDAQTTISSDSHGILGADPEVVTNVLTTEEEGIAIAAGSWLGGKRSVVLMQSSGVGNCINMLSLTQTCRFPFLTLVTMRGEWGEFNPWQVPMGSATPAVLELAGLKVLRASSADEVRDVVEAAAAQVYNACTPTAVLLSQRLIGAKVFTKADHDPQ